MGKQMLMPKLGMTMEKGKILNWLVNEGDKISKGDAVAEVETDKVNLEIESLDDGYLLKIFARAGEEVLVNQPIAFIGELGEQVPALASDLPGSESSPGIEEIAHPTEQRVETDNQFDVDLVVIGGGPGGYVAAIRAAQLGARVKLIEKDQVGGTCLNRGCIPTKSLVRNAHIWRSISEASDMGIFVQGASFDWEKIINRKDAVVSQLVKGVEGLLKKNKVELVRGLATVIDHHTVRVQNESTLELKTRYILLATGTVPAQIPLEQDPGVEILNTDQILNLRELPKSLAIIGGGVIGVEIASIFNAFGVEVSIIEIMPSLLSMADEEIVKVLQSEFNKRGIKVFTGVSVKKVKKTSSKQQIVLADGRQIEAEKVLLAVGRKPDKEAYASIDLMCNQKGYIEVNKKMETSISNVLAIGDITGNLQLAHVASAQAITAVTNLYGKELEINYETVPSCIFTDPEIAFAGMTEQQVKAANIPYITGKFPFVASGKAVAMGNTRGFVKIIADARWHEILGVHIIGPEAVNLIAEVVVAMKLEATVEELASAIHAHPTLSEAIMEAAEGIGGKAIHW